MQACGMCEAKEIYWFGWSFGTWTCKHVTCVEHRKCSCLGGVLGPGHTSMWDVWNTGNVLVWVEF